MHIVDNKIRLCPFAELHGGTNKQAPVLPVKSLDDDSERVGAPATAARTGFGRQIVVRLLSIPTRTAERNRCRHGGRDYRILFVVVVVMFIAAAGAATVTAGVPAQAQAQVAPPSAVEAGSDGCFTCFTTRIMGTIFDAARNGSRHCGHKGAADEFKMPFRHVWQNCVPHV